MRQRLETITGSFPKVSSMPAGITPSVFRLRTYALVLIDPSITLVKTTSHPCFAFLSPLISMNHLQIA